MMPEIKQLGPNHFELTNGKIVDIRTKIPWWRIVLGIAAFTIIFQIII